MTGLAADLARHTDGASDNRAGSDVALFADGRDASICAAITRRHARTFTLASHLLPAAKRRACFAIYAFCRLADDIVDMDCATHGAAGQTMDREETGRLLTDYVTELESALAGSPRGAVFRELVRMVTAHHIPASVLRELLSGIGRDLTPTTYASWADLGVYCEGVASSVGEMCTHVFGVVGGVEEHERAVRYARTLGVAMQLTNILRDVGEDARRGRCYLPEDELATVGLTEADVITAGRLGDRSFATARGWRELMRFQVARARSLYAAAAPGIHLLAPDARRCATACANGYAAILGALESRSYDSISDRARVGQWRRAGILWRAWRQGGAVAPATVVGDGPSVAWEQPVPIRLEALSRTVA